MSLLVARRASVAQRALAPATVAVPVRAFDGVDDVIRFSAPTYWGTTTPFSIVTVVKRRAPGSDWEGMFSLGPDVGGPSIVWEFGSGSGGTVGIELVHNGSSHASQTDPIWSAYADWELVAVSWNNNSGFERFHHFDGTTWRHLATNLGGASTISAWVGANEIRFGNWNPSFNFIDGLMAVQGLWVGTALSDVQVEALAGGTKATWIAAGASHLWELNQAAVGTAVQDAVGTCHEFAKVGTNVVTVDLPTSLYQFGPAAPSYVTAVRADTPAYYWQMNTTGATMPEDTGGPSMALTAATPGATGATAGLGTAVTFNGTTSYGRVNGVNLSGTDKITTECWLKIPSYDNNDSLALEHGESNEIAGWAWDPDSSNGGLWSCFTLNGDVTGFYEENMSRPAAGWHHIVVTIDRPQSAPNIMHFYVDGVEQTGGNPGINSQSGNFRNYPLNIMCRSGRGDGARNLLSPGDMQHLAIYPRILTLTQIQAHYAAR